MESTRGSSTSMKFRVPRPVLPRFQFTADNESDVISLVGTLVGNLIKDEQGFSGSWASHVDATLWKQLGQRDGVFVYGERDDGAVDNAVKQAVPSLLVVGAIPGTLDYVLYNFTTPSRESTLIKTSYVDDGVVDVEVLHQIYGPTQTAPFSHVAIKWVVVPPHFGIISARDFVIVDTVDTRVLPDGQRIGYRVTHSIEVPGADPLGHQGVVRSSLSICSIFRPHEFGQVHVYGRVFSDSGGEPSVSCVLGHAASASSSAIWKPALRL